MKLLLILLFAASIFVHESSALEDNGSNNGVGPRGGSVLRKLGKGMSMSSMPSSMSSMSSSGKGKDIMASARMKMMMTRKKEMLSYTDKPGFHSASFPMDYIIFDGYGDDKCSEGEYLESHGYPLGVCQAYVPGLWYLNLAAYNAATTHTLLAYQFYTDKTCETAADIPSGTFNWQGCLPREGFYKTYSVGPQPEYLSGVYFQTFSSKDECYHETLPVDYSWQKEGVCTNAVLAGAVGLVPGDPVEPGTPLPYTVTMCDYHTGKVTITAYATTDTKCAGDVEYILEYDTDMCYPGTVSGETSGYYAVKCL